MDKAFDLAYKPKPTKTRKEMDWMQAKRKYPKMSPMGDADKDKVRNWVDCKPFDKKKQGSIQLPKMQVTLPALPQIKQPVFDAKNIVESIKKRTSEMIAKMKQPEVPKMAPVDATPLADDSYRYRGMGPKAPLPPPPPPKWHRKKPVDRPAPPARYYWRERGYLA